MTSNRTRQEPSAETPPEAPDAAPVVEEGLVASTLAYVRTVDDGVVQVDAGGSLPAGAVPDFAAQLRDKGVLVTQAEYDDLVAASEKKG